jgi:ferritin
MVLKSYEEDIEKALNEFTEKRALIGDEIVKIRDESKRALDVMFNNLVEKLQAESERTDATIEDRIREMKKYINCLKEIDVYLTRAKSVLELTKDIGVRAF